MMSQRVIEQADFRRERSRVYKFILPFKRGISLWTFWLPIQYAVKEHTDVEMLLHAFLTFALVGGE